MRRILYLDPRLCRQASILNQRFKVGRLPSPLGASVSDAHTGAA